MTCVGGGAIGAAISVMLRISHRQHLDYEAILAGAARWRILLGWAFALAVLACVKGGIIAVFVDPTAAVLATIAAGQQPTEAAQVTSWFFWGSIGILAGFNERWATSLLSRATSDSPDPTPARQEASRVVEGSPRSVRA